MKYDWLMYDEIVKYPYPNLMAELKESGYSIATLSDWMWDSCCAEDDPHVWAKLRGESLILASESLSLSLLFNASLDYLFSDKLTLLDGEPYAKIRREQGKEKHFQRMQCRCFSEGRMV